MFTLIIYLLLSITIQDQPPQIQPTPTMKPDYVYQLLENGNFEIDGDGDSIPDNWNGVGGKLVCSTVTCEYRFKRSSFIQRLSQTVVSQYRTPDTLYLSADGRGAGWSGRGLVRVQIAYADGTQGKVSLTLPTGEMAARVYADVDLTKEVEQIKVKVIARSDSGRLWVDNVSLVQIR